MIYLLRLCHSTKTRCSLDSAPPETASAYDSLGGRGYFAKAMCTYILGLIIIRFRIAL